MAVRAVLRNWLVVYVANFVGAAATAALVVASGRLHAGDGSVVTLVISQGANSYTVTATAGGGTTQPSAAQTTTITDLYREILGRDPDPSGIATYTAAMANGMTADQLRAHGQTTGHCECGVSHAGRPGL